MKDSVCKQLLTVVSTDNAGADLESLKGGCINCGETVKQRLHALQKIYADSAHIHLTHNVSLIYSSGHSGAFNNE